MKLLTAVSFSIATCRSELKELADLLASKQELSENEDLRPFFRERSHLSALFASFNPQAAYYDGIGYEYDVFGDFRADVVAADVVRHAYTLVEFEDARPESVFCRTGRHAPEWAARFEHGFSQVIDWFYAIDDLKATGKFEERFESRDATFVGALILGRDGFLDRTDKRRLTWRTQNLAVNSKTIICMTFDDLYRFFARKLLTFQEADA